jgi:hypothetical protein
MAGFSELERIVLTAKALMGNVLDAQETSQWYEGKQPFQFSLGSEMVWLEADIVRQFPAANLATAQANVAGGLAGIIFDASLAVNAVRLTAVPGINNTYVALSTYGDFTSTPIRNWLKPSFVQQASGQPSVGYAVRLFEGDPNAGGVEIFTTDGQTGTGINKTPAWYMNYDNGMLLLSATNGLGVTDPYILGFYYIGEVLSSGSVPSAKQTTTFDAVPVVIDTVPMPTDGIVLVQSAIVAKQQGLLNSAAYVVTARVTVGGGVPTIGTVQTDYTDESVAAWGATIVNNAGSIDVEVTGAGGTTIDWSSSTASSPSIGSVTPISVVSTVPNWTLFSSGGYNAQPASNATITMLGDARDDILPGQPVRLFVDTALEFNDGGAQLSGYNLLTGVTPNLMGDRGRLYYSVVDLGAGNWRVDIFSNESRVTQVGQSAVYNGLGNVAISAVAGSGLGGQLTIDALGPADVDIYTEHYRWFIVDAITAGLLTLGGPPLTVAAGWVKAMWIGLTQRIAQSEFFIQGTFADGGGTTLLKDLGLTAFQWRSANARLAKAAFYGDTITNTPTLKIRVGGASAMTTGLTLSVSQTWVDSAVEFDPSNTLIAKDTSLEIECTDEGAAGDSDLTASTVWVLE